MVTVNLRTVHCVYRNQRYFVKKDAFFPLNTSRSSGIYWLKVDFNADTDSAFCGQWLQLPLS